MSHEQYVLNDKEFKVGTILEVFPDRNLLTVLLDGEVLSVTRPIPFLPTIISKYLGVKTSFLPTVGTKVMVVGEDSNQFFFNGILHDVPLFVKQGMFKVNNREAATDSDKENFDNDSLTSRKLQSDVLKDNEPKVAPGTPSNLPSYQDTADGEVDMLDAYLLGLRIYSGISKLSAGGRLYLEASTQFDMMRIVSRYFRNETTQHTEEVWDEQFLWDKQPSVYVPGNTHNKSNPSGGDSFGNHSILGTSRMPIGLEFDREGKFKQSDNFVEEDKNSFYHWYHSSYLNGVLSFFGDNGPALFDDDDDSYSASGTARVQYQLKWKNTFPKILIEGSNIEIRRKTHVIHPHPFHRWILRNYLYDDTSPKSIDDTGLKDEDLFYPDGLDIHWNNGRKVSKYENFISLLQGFRWFQKQTFGAKLSKFRLLDKETKDLGGEPLSPDGNGKENGCEQFTSSLRFDQNGNIILQDGFGNSIVMCKEGIKIVGSKVEVVGHKDMVLRSSNDIGVLARRNIAITTAVGSLDLRGATKTLLLCDAGTLFLESNACIGNEEGKKFKGDDLYLQDEPSMQSGRFDDPRVHLSENKYGIVITSRNTGIKHYSRFWNETTVDSESDNLFDYRISPDEETPKESLGYTIVLGKNMKMNTQIQQGGHVLFDMAPKTIFKINNPSGTFAWSGDDFTVDANMYLNFSKDLTYRASSGISISSPMFFASKLFVDDLCATNITVLKSLLLNNLNVIHKFTSPLTSCMQGALTRDISDCIRRAEKDDGKLDKLCYGCPSEKGRGTAKELHYENECNGDESGYYSGESSLFTDSKQKQEYLRTLPLSQILSEYKIQTPTKPWQHFFDCTLVGSSFELLGLQFTRTDGATDYLSYASDERNEPFVKWLTTFPNGLKLDTEQVGEQSFEVSDLLREPTSYRHRCSTKTCELRPGAMSSSVYRYKFKTCDELWQLLHQDRLDFRQYLNYAKQGGWEQTIGYDMMITDRTSNYVNELLPSGEKYCSLYKNMNGGACYPLNVADVQDGSSSFPIPENPPDPIE